MEVYLRNKFEYGTKKYGYWSLKHLTIQLEDCNDAMKGIYGNNFILQFVVDHSWGHYQQCGDGLNVNAINVGHGGRQRIMHYSKITKTCLGKFVSGGFAILKVGNTQNVVFSPNYVGPYEIPINEIEELHNGYVTVKKWFNKTKSEILQQLWPKLIETLPGKINGTFMMLVKRIYFDKNKKSLKIKDNKNISADRAIKLCEQYNTGLQKKQLKQKLIK